MNERNVYVIDGDGDRGRDGHGDPQGERRAKRGFRRSIAGAHGGLPRLAATCSLFVCGSGHVLHRRWKTGVAYLAAPLLAVALHLLLRSEWPRLQALATDQGRNELDLLFGLLLADLLIVAVLLAGVYSAYALGRACSGSIEAPRPHPLLPASASFLMPGWGQIVNGQPLKALGFLAPTYAGVLAAAAWWAIPDAIERLLGGLPGGIQPAMVGTGLAALAAAIWAVSLYDATLLARYRRLPNASRRATRPTSTRRPAPTAPTTSQAVRLGSR